MRCAAYLLHRFLSRWWEETAAPVWFLVHPSPKYAFFSIFAPNSWLGSCCAAVLLLSFALAALVPEGIVVWRERRHSVAAKWAADRSLPADSWQGLEAGECRLRDGRLHVALTFGFSSVAYSPICKPVLQRLFHHLFPCLQLSQASEQACHA